MNGDGTEALIPLTLAFCVGDWQPGTAVRPLHTPSCPAAESQQPGRWGRPGLQGGCAQGTGVTLPRCCVPHLFTSCWRSPG